MIHYFLSTPRWLKRTLSITYDLAAIYFAFILAWALRVGNTNYVYTYLDQISVGLAACVSIFIFVRLGLYRAILRYVTQEAFVTIAMGVTFSSLVLAACSFMIGGKMPRSVPIIYGCIAFIALGAPRLLFRSLVYWLNPRDKTPVIIYGAGETGNHLAAALQMGSEFHPVAFVDDNHRLQNSSIRGVPVYGPQQIPELVKKFKAQSLLLALGETTRKKLAKTIKNIGPIGIKIATIPKISDLVHGQSHITDLRDVQISDVLGREPVEPMRTLMGQNVTGKAVLVTGAGGSIGAELCKQIIALKPQKLVMLDNSEFNLYKLCEQLKTIDNAERLTFALADVRNSKSVSDVIQKHNPFCIFHAAAYKHVPIVEANSWEGIRNNTYGTLVVGQAAIAFNVKHFVLISTDKAVRPTNIMGATKRAAELVIQALQLSSPETKFSAVRFGNVLDSSGSVLPKFREQIAAGGPVTVTHPEVTRYFMTLQEAAQLVIQSSALCNSGDIFVLDMGEPVKIADLAKEMIALSTNKAQNGDFVPPKITYTGLRPGEKLYEELLLTKQCSGTVHPRIWLDSAIGLDATALNDFIIRLEAAVESKNIMELEHLILSDITDYQRANITEQNRVIESNIIPLFESNKL